jgi:protein O-GlcNAc transferase
VNKNHYAKLEALSKAEDWVAMERLARSYIKANKRELIAWTGLSTALEKQGKDAMPAIKQALILGPNDPQAYFNMGCGLRKLGKHRESIAYFKRSIELKPDHAPAWCNLGNAYQRVGEPYTALRIYFEGIKLAPNVLETQLNMGNCFLTIGDHIRAAKTYQMAIQIAEASDIKFIEAYNALIFAHDLMPETTIESAQAERRRWYAKFGAGLREDRPHYNDPNPGRRLRIGYCSADFRKHSAARSFAPVIIEHDREQFEVFAYHSSKHVPDEYTAMFKKNVDHWYDTSLMSDQEVADLVRQHQIDILVDLSGHTGGNRLLAFARKPAPIQCTGWGYATGTGLPEIDVFFADAVDVPESERHFYTEEIHYLPCVVSSYWVETFPDVNALPAFEDGNITFGSINRFAKVTEETIRLWAKVLLAVPNSGMVLRAGELGEEAHRARVIAFFAALGIPSDRLILVGPADTWEDHMRTLNQIDICLDPIPHGGGVTTLETLMMGVPVITLRWPTIVGRLSSSILTALQMTDWIAETKDEYIAKAIEKSDDLQSLSKLRQGLRARFQASPIGDGPAYCRAVEANYRDLWRRWCAHKVVDAQEIAA